MSVLSGSIGRLCIDGGTAAFQTVTNWRINPKITVASERASDSGGATFGLPAVKDFSGSFDFNPGLSPLTYVVPGTAYQLRGQLGSREILTGVIIDKVTLKVPVSAGGMITASAQFSSIGSSTSDWTANNTIWTEQATTSITNAGPPNALTSNGTKVQWALITGGVLGTYTKIPHVVDWELTLEAKNHAFVTDDTGAVTKRINEFKHVSGLRVNTEEGALDTLNAAALGLLPGSIGALRMFLNSTIYCQISYGILSGRDINVPVGSGGSVTNGLEWEYTKYTEISSVYTAGTVVVNAVTFI